MNVAIVALGIWTMETHAQSDAVGIAKLQAESADKLPLRLGAQLVRHGHVHRAPNPRVPTFLGLLRPRGKFRGPITCQSRTLALCFDQSCFSPVRLLVNLQRVL